MRGLVPLLAALACGAAPAAQPVAWQDEPSVRQFLDDSLVTVERRGERVRFETHADSELARYDPRRHQWTRAFTLAEGGRFFQRDHHARLEFTVVGIGDDGVHIGVRPVSVRNGQEQEATVVSVPYR